MYFFGSFVLLTTDDSEESSLPPEGAPIILTDPIINRAFRPPPNNLKRVVVCDATRWVCRDDPYQDVWHAIRIALISINVVVREKGGHWQLHPLARRGDWQETSPLQRRTKHPHSFLSRVYFLKEVCFRTGGVVEQGFGVYPTGDWAIPHDLCLYFSHRFQLVLCKDRVHRNHVRLNAIAAVSF